MDAFVKAIEVLYTEVDAETQKFAEETGLECPPGCGRCCENPRGIWATPAEMLPMARKRLAFESFTFEGLTSATEFCASFLSSTAKGRCSDYPERPLVCRLFGSSFGHKKGGELQPLRCPLQVTAKKKFNDHGVIATTWMMKLRSIIPPGPLLEQMPINDALRQAIEWLILRRAYQNEPSLMENEITSGEEVCQFSPRETPPPLS